MTEVFVYVEGPSDKLGMESLLSSVIKTSLTKGNSLTFISMNGKDSLLRKGPAKALNILRNRPDSWVFLVPDLYPPNKVLAHTTYNELKNGLVKRFSDDIQKKDCDQRLIEHFRVHCFKYDLEVLILASEDVLLKRLNQDKFSLSWTIPVEDQDHNKPPKRIVEKLFSSVGKKYKDTIDVPWILERCDYKELMTKCNQNFKSFIEDLLNITA